jgi:hypothetical protein
MAIMAGVHGLAMLALDGMLAEPESGGCDRFAQLGQVTLTLLDAGLVSYPTPAKLSATRAPRSPTPC